MGQLVVVSNRVAIPEKIAKVRPGGLEVAIKAALKDKTGIWFGWSGKIAAQAKTLVVWQCSQYFWRWAWDVKEKADAL